ncbi:ribosome-binding factor A [Pokkaliibacter plantistimulans]|uniref:Ribosome-binding factor A n=2 Tax=Pseudomonadota TaxID=1224 RepID=A0ABX5LUY7_9GAMM|nr:MULTISPECIES: 30S ribosome-binding factor RbfA [Pokkaliibacter]MDH2434150.1 30S ribosome-binding factor RbfA [Pokkaliibacter sp. MBI-7]PPC79120.1 30S ribosome-binding factor RbfA [Pokkaliibacter plantistimulans]PXF30151.1 ribosome-binding factor A [Pokkaliibacter plantistimulans]
MPKEFSRTQRVADQIQKDLAGIVQLEMKDPRLGIITISDVRVSKDLNYADVYFTLLSMEEGEEVYRQGEKILNQAAGFLRTELARGLKTMRVIPALRFHYDHTLNRGNQISALITRAVREDKARQDPTPDSQADNDTE